MSEKDREDQAKKDAERETADWVEEQGGMDEIKHHYAFMVEQIAKRVGVDHHPKWAEHVVIGKIIDELDKRLMPLGMEWPRYMDGTQVKIGDMIGRNPKQPNLSNRAIISRIDFSSGAAGEVFLRELFGGVITTVYPRNGERISRSYVTAADHKPINLDETLYRTDSLRHIQVDQDTFDKFVSRKISADLYTHERKDSFLAIRNDSTVSPLVYCREVLGLRSDKEIDILAPTPTEAMIRSLLSRQRNLMKGDAK